MRRRALLLGSSEVLPRDYLREQPFEDSELEKIWHFHLDGRLGATISTGLVTTLMELPVDLNVLSRSGDWGLRREGTLVEPQVYWE